MNPLTNFRDFMDRVRPENKEKYEELHRSVESAYKENATKDVIAIFGKYLYIVGQKVAPNFYKSLIIFIRLYLGCMNEYGWEIVKRQRDVTAEEQKREFIKEDNTIDYVPDICNDFIKYYLPQEFPTFNNYLAIEIIRHLCDWLYKNEYTKKHILLM